ncbi:MAG: hypothetical protein JRG96_09175 [Deltaproteobacteria bacterium]|nr:hypothetical protein [Deltaproteobacteria bacterium]MBW2419008.1 hypothetical protein [Deltaproteobacteria bacterium]
MSESDETTESGEVRCDFCGHEVTSVSRIALDGEYERLRTPHEVRYACAPCSEKKERQRLGLDHR